MSNAGGIVRVFALCPSAANGIENELYCNLHRETQRERERGPDLVRHVVLLIWESWTSLLASFDIYLLIHYHNNIVHFVILFVKKNVFYFSKHNTKYPVL